MNLDRLGKRTTTHCISGSLHQWGVTVVPNCSYCAESEGDGDEGAGIMLSSRYIHTIVMYVHICSSVRGLG